MRHERAKHIVTPAPAGHCSMCWNRWGRAFKSKETPECAMREGACASIDSRWTMHIPAGDTIDGLLAKREAAIKAYECRAIIPEKPKKKKSVI